MELKWMNYLSEEKDLDRVKKKVVMLKLKEILRKTYDFKSFKRWLFDRYPSEYG